jgi:hypothetical protein
VISDLQRQAVSALAQIGGGIVGSVFPYLVGSCRADLQADVNLFRDRISLKASCVAAT